MGNQRHADTTPHGSRGSAAKALVIAAICLIGGLTFAGLPIFETSLCLAYAVMVMVEVALAVVLFFSRWTNKPAAVVLVLLALFQAGQSYFNEQMRYTSADPVIPIDNFGVLFLCALAVYLIKKGQPWPVLPTTGGRRYRPPTWDARPSSASATYTTYTPSHGAYVERLEFDSAVLSLLISAGRPQHVLWRGQREHHSPAEQLKESTAFS
ncbi:hypothetical protein MPC38_13665 [Prescottella equi]|uniref:hypothetical protein n=1 Tax=Rhodococcus hoagii TaxID=43767 RepID=UPI001F5B629E|nr:hypothetical protein [Prescottella equi]UNQ37812.1 hypothetical protein MPC38_13665 [Prescottella equi]